MKIIAAALAVFVLIAPASAQIAISANDGEIVLVNGKTIASPKPEPDTITIIDLSVRPPRVLGEIEVRTSVIGPPESVAIARDKSYALVTGATKIDPADATKYVPDNKLSVVDLTARKVTQTLEAGLGASGVSISPGGDLALVCNRAEDTISIFTIAGKSLTPAGKISFPAKASPSHVVFIPDGSKALVTRDGDSRISVLAIDHEGVKLTDYEISAGLHPYSIAMNRAGDFAVVANMAGSGRDNGSLSLIDLKSDYPHVVNTVNVAPTPEGLALSADGNFIASSSINGSNLTPGAQGFHDLGLVQVFRRKGFNLQLIATAKTGHWCEGAAWSRDHRTLLVQCMVEKQIFVYSFDGKSLKRTGAIAVKGGPAGIRVAE